MATRFKTGARSFNGMAPLPSGYENTTGTPDLSIPSCGVEDVDVAVFNLFDKEIIAEFGGINSAPLQKVPVVFAAGEKWAMLKNGRPLRDRNSTLILPLITVMRTEMTQGIAEDVNGRGINQQVGEIVIKRRLDKTDRNYQSLLNKLLLSGQRNLAVGPTDPQVQGQVTTERKIGELSQTKDAIDGAYLNQVRTNNVWETIVVPTPQFYTVKYQVTVWTQYTQHANQIIEKIFSSLLPQGQCWKLSTAKGYWFIAKIEDGSLALETNFDDISTSERFIKHNFIISVPAYFFASTSPGAPVPVKRYVSSPTIIFETTSYDPVELGSSTQVSEYEVGSDDPTLPIADQKNNRPDQRTRKVKDRWFYPVQPLSSIGTTLEDPAINGYISPGDPPPAGPNAAIPRGFSIKVVNKTPRGETVFSGASLGGLEIVLSDKDTKI